MQTANRCGRPIPSHLKDRVDALLAIEPTTSGFGEMMSEVCRHLDETGGDWTEELVAQAERVRDAPSALIQEIWARQCRRILIGFSRSLYQARDILVLTD